MSAKKARFISCAPLSENKPTTTRAIATYATNEPQYAFLSSQWSHIKWSHTTLGHLEGEVSPSALEHGARKFA
jgi:hypothetical protein